MLPGDSAGLQSGKGRDVNRRVASARMSVLRAGRSRATIRGASGVARKGPATEQRRHGASSAKTLDVRDGPEKSLRK